MIEDQILDETLGLIDENGTENAYNYLLTKLDLLENRSSQVYNFLYCLAATSGKREEALNWLEEAILNNGIWYRPEVFEDEDLDSIREDERFIHCEVISKQRYEKEIEVSKTSFTLEEVDKDNLLIVLHGNQQNNIISKAYWSNLVLEQYQVEYLQSEEIDSYQLYRWEEDGTGPNQIEETVKTIENNYETIVLAGFSAGCNAILRAILEKNIVCHKVILNSPWIPIIEEESDRIIRKLKTRNIEVLVICGKDDSDCYPQCLKFDEVAQNNKYDYIRVYESEVGHEYSKDLIKIVSRFLG
jgi:hypothetical protein